MKQTLGINKYPAGAPTHQFRISHRTPFYMEVLQLPSASPSKEEIHPYRSHASIWVYVKVIAFDTVNPSMWAWTGHAA